MGDGGSRLGTAPGSTSQRPALSGNLDKSQITFVKNANPQLVGPRKRVGMIPHEVEMSALLKGNGRGFSVSLLPDVQSESKAVPGHNKVFCQVSTTCPVDLDIRQAAFEILMDANRDIHHTRIDIEAVSGSPKIPVSTSDEVSAAALAKKVNVYVEFARPTRERESVSQEGDSAFSRNQ